MPIRTSKCNRLFIEDFIFMTKIHQSIKTLHNSNTILMIEASPLMPDGEPDRYSFIHTKDKLVLILRNGNTMYLDCSTYTEESQEAPKGWDSWNEFVETMRLLEGVAPILIGEEELLDLSLKELHRG